MIYDLPKSVEIDEIEYPIRSDYRAILDIICALNDVTLEDFDKVQICLEIFYPKDVPPDTEKALQECFKFINCGEEPKETEKKPRLMDWEQDFPIIIGAMNAVAGKEVRAEKYLHWYTFIGYYQNIGDCMFSTVVGIRKKKSKGMKLDKSEQEFYKNNRELVDFKTKLTDEETNTFNKWIGGK